MVARARLSIRPTTGVVGRGWAVKFDEVVIGMATREGQRSGMRCEDVVKWNWFVSSISCCRGAQISTMYVNAQ
jgi:hypothetical protein